MLAPETWPIYNKARARIARRGAARRDAENSDPNSGTERRSPSSPDRAACTVISVTHREYQVEEEQQVLDASHAAGHHFRHSHCVPMSFESLNRTPCDVRTREGNRARFSLLHEEVENSDAFSFSLATPLHSLSLSLSLFRLSFVLCQRPELHEMLARRLFAVKCTG